MAMPTWEKLVKKYEVLSILEERILEINTIIKAHHAEVLKIIAEIESQRAELEAMPEYGAEIWQKIAAVKKYYLEFQEVPKEYKEKIAPAMRLKIMKEFELPGITTRHLKKVVKEVHKFLVGKHYQFLSLKELYELLVQLDMASLPKMKPLSIVEFLLHYISYVFVPYEFQWKKDKKKFSLKAVDPSIVEIISQLYSAKYPDYSDIYGEVVLKQADLRIDSLRFQNFHFKGTKYQILSDSKFETKIKINAKACLKYSLNNFKNYYDIGRKFLLPEKDRPTPPYYFSIFELYQICIGLKKSISREDIAHFLKGYMDTVKELYDNLLRIYADDTTTVADTAEVISTYTREEGSEVSSKLDTIFPSRSCMVVESGSRTGDEGYESYGDIAPVRDDTIGEDRLKDCVSVINDVFDGLPAPDYSLTSDRDTSYDYPFSASWFHWLEPKKAGSKHMTPVGLGEKTRKDLAPAERPEIIPAFSHCRPELYSKLMDHLNAGEEEVDSERRDSLSEILRANPSQPHSLQSKMSLFSTESVSAYCEKFQEEEKEKRRQLEQTLSGWRHGYSLFDRQC